MADGTAFAEAAAPDPSILAEMTAEIVAAYVQNNSVPVGDLPALLSTVHGALAGLGAEPEAAPEPAKLVPPVPIRKTITDEFLISLEDGKPYKTLKRHLAGRGLTTEAYREKWGLPRDYPMVAANYAKARSESAKARGLGRKTG